MAEKQTTIKVLLAFDFGMKRIGVAVGQTITQQANPLKVLRAKEGEPNWGELEKLMKKWRPDALVVGIPLNMDGTSQRITLDAQTFAKRLSELFKLPVFTIDERLTTKDAREQLFTEKGYGALLDGQVDCVAAQLILQNWFAENLKN